MSARSWLGCFGACGFLLFAGHVADIGSRGTLLEQFLSDRARGTARIVEAYGLAVDHCAGEHGHELYPLAAAFLTVESFATSHLQAWSRGAVARLAAASGLSVDISVGPGRIRPSTALDAIRNANAHGAGASDRNASVVRRLLEPCSSVQVAIAILKNVKQDHTGPVDLRFVRRATAVYNGQSATVRSLEKDISAQIYFELVYHAFQHYRFTHRS